MLGKLIQEKKIMGITIDEYLKNRESCDVCKEGDDEEHCVTTLLSRLDTCLIYNAIEFNNNPFDDADVLLLQNLRSSLTEEQVVDYYIRSERLVHKIKAIHGDEIAYWEAFYSQYVADIVRGLKTNDNSMAIGKIYAMLIALEATDIV